MEFFGECVSVYNGSMRWERAVCGMAGGSFFGVERMGILIYNVDINLQEVFAV